MRGERRIADRVQAAMASVPRRWFLPDSVQAYAAEDRPLPIGHGQTNSQPTTVARMLTQLDPQPGDTVLDVGCGSGWSTALLAHLVGDPAAVHGVELVPELVTFARQRLDAVGFADAEVTAADPDRLGLPEHAPFAKVLVSAEAAELPQQLVDQVSTDGRMVLPVAGRLLVVDRPQGRTVVRQLGRYAFVPLRWSGS